MLRSIRVKVVYALKSQQVVEELTAPVGSTAREVVAASSLPAKFPDMDLDVNGVGIYSRLIDPDHVVQDGDRIEIYRPLEADPKTVRRELAKQGRTMGKRGGR